MQLNFQAGVDDVYDACVAKGSTPGSYSLSDVVQGIMDIPSGITPSGTISITSNGTGIDVSSYATADVAVPNTNTATYTASSSSSALDMGATNNYRYVNTSALTKVSGSISITSNGSKNVAAYSTASVSVNRTLYVWTYGRSVRISTSSSATTPTISSFSANASADWQKVTSFSAM